MLERINEVLDRAQLDSEAQATVVSAETTEIDRWKRENAELLFLLGEQVELLEVSEMFTTIQSRLKPVIPDAGVRPVRWLPRVDKLPSQTTLRSIYGYVFAIPSGEQALDESSFFYVLGYVCGSVDNLVEPPKLFFGEEPVRRVRGRPYHALMHDLVHSYRWVRSFADNALKAAEEIELALVESPDDKALRKRYDRFLTWAADYDERCRPAEQYGLYLDENPWLAAPKFNDSAIATKSVPLVGVGNHILQMQIAEALDSYLVKHPLIQPRTQRKR